MSCCCSNDGKIIIVRGNDTDFNGGNLVEFNIRSDIYDVADFKAKLVLGDIIREYDDLSSGVIDFNLTDDETKTLPYGDIDGTLYFIDSEGRIATITSVIPFKVISTVNNNAIATSDVDYTINVKQGGENIFNIDVQSAVSVSVGETETLPAGSDAYVQNVGTNNHLVLNFGIPAGESGESATITVGTTETLPSDEDAYVNNSGTQYDAVFNFGIPKGEQGEQGEAGEDAKINGYNSIALISGTGISIQQQGNETVISSTGGVAEWGSITGNIENQTDLQDEFDTKQDVISDLSTIRSGATLGSTSLQPSDVLNSVESTATNKALSANMGKELQDQIDNLKARGRFLALWNCATGLAMSNPPTGSYTYATGDYFVVGVVASGSGTNYKPDGSTYTTGVASTTVETEQVDVDDVYYYDGNVWRLQVNTQKTTSFANIAGDPYDNTNLATALNAKQDTISDLATIRSGASLGATSVQPADLADYAKKNIAQTFTAKQTFGANVEITDGNALQSGGSDLIQRDDTNNDIEVGNGSDSLSLSGSGARPKYNNNDLALSADVLVDDVQINATSILNNKVANIPLSGYSRLGVSQLYNNTYGLQIDNNGGLTVYKAQDTDITAKTNNYRPLVSSSIDNAVKVGITTNTNTLTSTEKQTATNWILPTQANEKVLGSDGTDASWDYAVEFIEWSD